MIRSATIDDAEAIAVIHVKTWQTAYADIFPAEFLAGLCVEKRAEAWRQLLAENQNTTLVAENAGVIVGWASGGVSRDTDAQGESELHALYVLPDYWGRGIAAELVSSIERVFSSSADATLWVLRDNHRAIRFYQKSGYTADGTVSELERGGVKRDEIRLRKRIRSPILANASVPTTNFNRCR